VDRPQEPGLKIGGESDPQEILLSRALAGDAEGAHWLVTLLQSAYYRDITRQMKSLNTGAHTNTIEDVFQETLIRFLERLKAGELKDLSQENRDNIIRYFQRLCDGRLRDEVRVRQSPVLRRGKEEVPETVLDQNARIPGDSRHTEHLSLIHAAIDRLEPFFAQVIRLYLGGVPLEDIASQTGRSPKAIRNLVMRLKMDLREDIVPLSATARVNYEADKARERKWPSRSQIEATIAILPPEMQDAVVFVHVERRSLDEFARKLGDRGYEKAQSRLKLAYRTLAGKMKVPFPEAFEKAAM